jgi:arabinosaccharide transport system substrate-binding protein
VTRTRTRALFNGLIERFNFIPLLFGVILVASLVVRFPLVTSSSEGDPLLMWSSAYPHIDVYRTIAEREAGDSPGPIEIHGMPFTAIDRRLRSAMWAGRGVPDLIEFPQERLGLFLTSDAASRSFVDLTERSREPGPGGVPIAEDAVGSRLELYRDRGRLIGLPHDVHPVMIAYRWRDFEDAGIDPDSLRTWDDFVRAGRRITRRVPTTPGTADDRRFMLSVDDRTPIVFQSLLLQRGGNWFDREGRVTIDSDLALDTMLWYIRNAYGPNRIADSADAFPSAGFYRAIETGYYTCFLCPDWLTKNLEINAPGLAGELRLMPLPAWSEGETRTSTWGGTMLGISSACEDPERAWAMIRYLYAERETAEEMFRETNIIPPYRSLWNMPALDEPDPYWSQQPIGRLYVSLAEETPELRNGPFPQEVLRVIANALAETGVRYQAEGEERLEQIARERLRSAANEIEILIERLDRSADIDPAFATRGQP